MTSSNRQFVEEIISAWKRGDFSTAEWAHATVRFVVAGQPSPRDRTDLTPEEWSAWMGAAGGFGGEDSGDIRLGGESYRELPDGRILVVSQLSAYVFSIRGIKVTELV